jgi:transcriptional regulator with XRE-family HTH domain
MTKSHFARRLTELRKAAGLTQCALAKRAGVTTQAVTFLEEGERKPTWETVERLAAALDVSC